MLRRLLRTRLEFSPVFAAPVQFDGHTFGYVRLVNFSQKAAVDMQKAVAQLQVGRWLRQAEWLGPGWAFL